MHTNKKVLAGLVILMPLIFWTVLFEGYTLPKWFLWQWGMLFIFLGEVVWRQRDCFAKHARNDNKLIVPVFVYPWFVFFFFSLLSLGVAVNLQLGLRTIADLFLGFSLFLFISNRWKDFEIKTLIPFLILPALPVAVYGIFQAFGHDFISLPGPFQGAVSTFGHRNFVAEYELMMMPLLLYGGFFYTAPLTPPLPKRGRNYKIRLVRGFSLVSLPVVYTHFIMTHTRGSYFALIATLLFMAGFTAALPGQKAKRWFAGTAALLLLLTGFFLVRNYNLPGEQVIGKRGVEIKQKSLAETTGAEMQERVEIPSSLRSRMLIWQATLAVFRKHPVAGVGTGNLNEVLPPYYPKELLKSFQGRMDAGTSHNEYLQVLAETGILGGVSFLAFLVLLLFFAVKASWRAAKERAEFLPFFLAAGILGILVVSFISSPLRRPVTLFFFWLFIGFLAVFEKEKGRFFILNRKIQEGVLIGFIAVLGVSAYGFGWRPIRADFYGQKSFAVYRAGNWQQAIAYVEKALSFQPQSRNLLTIAGNTYLNAGYFEEAIYNYGKIIIYHPYWPRGYGNMGLVLAQAGFFADAEKYLKYSLRLDDYQPLVHNTLGAVYLQQGKRAEAKGEFLKAIALDPTFSFPRLNLQEMEN
ncbi:MAG: O-antigen ligase family protein [Candidatus Omnitrophota bacterium]